MDNGGEIQIKQRKPRKKGEKSASTRKITLASNDFDSNEEAAEPVFKIRKSKASLKYQKGPEVRKDTLASTPPATDYSAAGLAALKAAQSAPPPMPDPQSPPKTEKTVPFAHALPQSVIPEGLTLPQNLEGDEFKQWKEEHLLKRRKAQGRVASKKSIKFGNIEQPTVPKDVDMSALNDDDFQEWEAEQIKKGGAKEGMDKQGGEGWSANDVRTAINYMDNPLDEGNLATYNPINEDECMLYFANHVQQLTLEKTHLATQMEEAKEELAQGIKEKEEYEARRVEEERREKNRLSFVDFIKQMFSTLNEETEVHGLNVTAFRKDRFKALVAYRQDAHKELDSMMMGNFRPQEVLVNNPQEEGLESDEEEEEDLKNYFDNIHDEASDLEAKWGSQEGGEAPELSDLLSRCEDLKLAEPELYSNLFMSSHLPLLASPFARRAMVDVDILDPSKPGFESYPWYQSLLAYGGDMTENDEDINLLPAVVEAVVVPKLETAMDGWYDLSSVTMTTHSIALAKTLEAYCPVNSSYINIIRTNVLSRLDCEETKARVSQSVAADDLFIRFGALVKLWLCVKVTAQALRWHPIIGTDSLREPVSKIMNEVVTPSLRALNSLQEQAVARPILQYLGEAAGVNPQPLQDLYTALRNRKLPTSRLAPKILEALGLLSA